MKKWVDNVLYECPEGYKSACVLRKKSAYVVGDVAGGIVDTLRIRNRNFSRADLFCSSWTSSSRSRLPPPVLNHILHSSSIGIDSSTSKKLLYTIKTIPRCLQSPNTSSHGRPQYLHSLLRPKNPDNEPSATRSSTPQRTTTDRSTRNNSL